MRERLPVNEIFHSVQGEASFTGTPATFVRLQGCPVGCGWCDTKHTWAVHARDEVPIRQMLGKVENSATHAYLSAADVLCALDAPRHVVLSGGEPAVHDLSLLTEAILWTGRTVQLETSGVFEPCVAAGTFITCSPKLDMPGGSAEPRIVARAGEIKFPVGKAADVARLRELLHECRTRHLPPDVPLPPVWLQPLSQSPKATALCVEAATEHGWRISIQTHKYLGVR